MGFPSPAKDFVESMLTVDRLCQIDGNCSVIETTTGYAVINRSFKPRLGNLVLISTSGHLHFARVKDASLQTDDGQTLSGEELDGVQVEGVVTFNILSVSAISPGGQE